MEDSILTVEAGDFGDEEETLGVSPWLRVVHRMYVVCTTKNPCHMEKCVGRS